MVWREWERAGSVILENRGCKRGYGLRENSRTQGFLRGKGMEGEEKRKRRGRDWRMRPEIAETGHLVTF